MYYLPFHRFPMSFIKQTSCFYYIIKKQPLVHRTETQLELTVYCIKNRTERSIVSKLFRDMKTKKTEYRTGKENIYLMI